MKTEEQKEFLRNYIPGHSVREVSSEYTKRFEPMTAQQVKQYKNNHKIKSGTSTGFKKGEHYFLWKKEEAEYIENEIVGKGIGTVEAVKILNEKFGTDYTYKQLQSFLKNRKLRTEYDAKYKKGNVPINCIQKGEHRGRETEFKKGLVPKTKKAIGTIRIRDGVKWIKVGEGNYEWEPLHRYLWEQANGEIPKGYSVVFLDGNKDNVELDNLRLADKQTSTSFTGKKHSTDRDIAEVQLNIAKVRMAVRSKNNDRKSRTDTVV